MGDKMISPISNSLSNYKVNSRKPQSKLIDSNGLGEVVLKAENKDYSPKVDQEETLRLTDEMRSDLIFAYNNVNWKSDESVKQLLNLGRSVGKITGDDIDEAMVCFEDPNLLNKYVYISNDNCNNVYNALEHDKNQMKAASDFYHYIPEYLEKRVESLQRVQNFLDWVSELK